MSQGESQGSFDPYRPLAQNLNSGDALNRWLLLRPRRKIVELLKGQRVLDVCCGTGNLAAMLAEAGCQVTGIDSSLTMLSQARRKHIPAEFRQMDAAQLPFDQEFDAAVISIALHEMPPGIREEVWQGMHRSVRMGGWVLALDFAVPKQDNLAARLTGALVERDERSFLNIYPAHYENFREFMRKGGLSGWMQQWSQPLRAEYDFWGGSLALAVVSASKPSHQAGASG